MVDADQSELGRASDLVAHYRQCGQTYQEAASGPAVTLVTRGDQPAHQVGDHLARCRDRVGDYQRHLVAIDPAGQPLAVVLQQMERLTAEVLPMLRLAP
jgi:hypothetical protein